MVEEDEFWPLEEERLRAGLMLDHERTRSKHWAHLKLFRSEQLDREFPLSQSVLAPPDLLARQKDQDKLLLGLVRLAALHDDEHRALHYLHLMTYTKVMRLAVRLCEGLNQRHIAASIAAYVTQREQQELYNEKKTPQTKIVEKIVEKVVLVEKPAEKVVEKPAEKMVEKPTTMIDRPISTNLGEKRIKPEPSEEPEKKDAVNAFEMMNQNALKAE